MEELRNMYFVSYEKINKQLGSVVAIYRNPVPSLVTGLEGIELEGDVEIPEREDIPSMDPYLRINLATKTMYYDYIGRETVETKVSNLQQENAELKQAIAELTMLIAMPTP